MNPECCMVIEVELEGIEPSGRQLGRSARHLASPEVGGHRKVSDGSGWGHVVMYTSPARLHGLAHSSRRGCWFASWPPPTTNGGLSDDQLRCAD